MKNKKLSLNILSGVLGSVVQSIVSLTRSLRGQLIKYFTTLQPNTHIFCRKNERSFLTSFQQKILVYFRYCEFKFLLNVNKQLH